jgi:hypothetical protein
MMLPRVALVLLAAGVASAAFPASGGGVILDWDDPALSLLLSDVRTVTNRVQIDLCVRPHARAGAGSTYVGYPRYRTATGRWGDSVVRGLGSDRSLHATAEQPACFSVLVARDATTLFLPLGTQKLQLDIGRWIAGAPTRTSSVEVSDAWQVETVPDEAETPPPPARPRGSDVDRDIPRSPSVRPSGLAVVLGVEAYAEAPPATHAAADARTAASYFEKALGIPHERIELLLDEQVTLGQLQRLFGEDGWLARRAKPDSDVFVFFAGHGMAEVEEFVPYLLPVDADPDYIRHTAFPVDRLIESLAGLEVRHTTVFLDACFGGLSREGGALLVDARPLVIVPVQPSLAGVSVFSAGTGGQVASALAEQGHGLFSYHLFRGLRGHADVDGDRRVNAGELKRPLEDVVPRAAESLDREQFPAIALEEPEQILVQLP